MKTWNKIPSWFNLSNYSDFASFSAEEWHEAILHRDMNFKILTSPEHPDAVKFRALARDFFEAIKTNPLIPPI